ncbi:GntR family transcriptional regulator [Poriferisphaera sp. WC338]|uniref:GntR family transcriptional regulator n=1 Tax=Poriferisphaera sp. WC338 TaxID=3425129 RepID=UPI003D817425
MNTAVLPKYERVKRTLISEIESGKWPAGGSFPSEYQLLEQFEVSRPTLIRALQQLVSEGYLYRKQGKGTFVADRATSAQDIELTGNFTVFISQRAASITGEGREVQLRILRGIQQVLGQAYSASTVRQAAADRVDVETRRFIEASEPGIALLIEPSFNQPLRMILEERGWSVWSINEPMDQGHCVYIDQEHAGYLATKYLIDEGRKQIAMINGPLDAYWGFEARFNGYKRAHAEAGLKVNGKLIREGWDTIDSEAGRKMMRSILDSKVKCDAVVGASDPKAIGARACAIEFGCNVPSEIAFVSIDNTLAGQIEPPMPAVAMPFEEMGFQAAMQANLTSSRAKERGHSYLRISLKPTLIER